MRFSVLTGVFVFGSVVLARAAPSQIQENGAAAADIQIPQASSSGVMRQYREAVRIRGPRPKAVGAGALTWKEAAKEALWDNPTLVADRLRVQQGREQVKIADAGFLPTINAGAGLNRGQGTQIFQGSPLSTSSGSYQGDLTGTWNFFNGFATLAARSEARATVQNDTAQYDQDSTALYLSLGQAFDQVLYDQQNLKLLKLLVDRYHSDTLYQAQEFKGGLTALWTYEKAQSDEAGEVWSYNQQRYSLVSDQAALAVLLGRDASAAEDLTLAGGLTAARAPADYHADLGRMLAANPTMDYYQSLVREADAAAWEAESSRYPSISASGSWGVSDQLGRWGPRNKEWQASLTASYELFAGGALEAAITQADEALRQAKETAAGESSQIRAAFIKAWIAYITADQRLLSEDMAVRAGTDRYATVGALYQAGLEEFLDYEQAESIYSGAQIEQLSGLFTAAQAEVAYRNAIGVTLEQAANFAAP